MEGQGESALFQILFEEESLLLSLADLFFFFLAEAFFLCLANFGLLIHWVIFLLLLVVGDKGFLLLLGLLFRH